MNSAVAEGYWKGGKFTFDVRVPEEYNNKVCVCNGNDWVCLMCVCACARVCVRVAS